MKNDNTSDTTVADVYRKCVVLTPLSFLFIVVFFCIIWFYIGFSIGTKRITSKIATGRWTIKTNTVVTSQTFYYTEKATK